MVRLSYALINAVPRATLPIKPGCCTGVKVFRSAAALWCQGSSAVSRAQQCKISPAIRPHVRQHICKASAADGGVEDASSSAAEASSKVQKSRTADTLFLGVLFAGWYLFNIWFNIYNKKVLKAFPYPLTCTTIQFGVGSLLALSMWSLRLYPRPRINADTVKNISPLAVVHTLGNALTNVSLGRVAVSFTHTIKAMEPFFSVLLSAVFLGEKASAPVLLSLVPIVGGVAAASVSEVTFDWGGFMAAMGSNVSFQSRNVLSKKFMGEIKGLDNINLFSIITMLSFALLLPVALFVDGAKFTPAALKAVGIANTGMLYQQLLIAALCFHAYQQVSYMILQRVSPVTHSIGNCLKRVIVIVASVVVFQNPMSRQNMFGTAVALGGVFAYSQVKRLSRNKKAA